MSKEDALCEIQQEFRAIGHQCLRGIKRGRENFLIIGVDPDGAWDYVVDRERVTADDYGYQHVVCIELTPGMSVTAIHKEAMRQLKPVCL